MFRQVFRRNMNRAERRYFLRRRKAKPKRYWRIRGRRSVPYQRNVCRHQSPSG